MLYTRVHSSCVVCLTSVSGRDRLDCPLPFRSTPPAYTCKADSEPVAAGSSARPMCRMPSVMMSVWVLPADTGFNVVHYCHPSCWLGSVIACRVRSTRQLGLQLMHDARTTRAESLESDHTGSSPTCPAVGTCTRLDSTDRPRTSAAASTWPNGVLCRSDTNLATPRSEPPTLECHR